jgi:GWxTD domain-containing protein
MSRSGKRRVDFVSIPLIFLILPLFAGEKIKEKDLAEPYRDFLNFVRYIMLPQEKDVFLQLTNDRDRNLFIESFWKQRDPTPGTPANEYKEEHLKRFNYANEKLGRGATRPGWMTDQGRMHIILGPPPSIERFYGTLGLNPCEVWTYYGDGEKGLPAQFLLIFYQKGGSGEFKLYDPVSEGPASLLSSTRDVDVTDYEELYDKIYELAPTLADASLSLIPGEIPFNYMPSPRNTMLIADIMESPRKDVSPAYATHFLDYRGLVSTEYMTNYVESDGSLAVFEDPLAGITFLHFSIVPKRISIDYYEPRDQFFCNFTLNVSLRNVQKSPEEIIFQYTKEFPFYFSPDEADRIKANGVAVEDSFPIIEGKHKLIVLLQNSVGEEFSLLEKEIDIPRGSEAAQIIGPYFGYNFQEYQVGLHVPFKVLDKKLVVDPKNTFSASDAIAFFFTVVPVDRDLWEKGKVKFDIKGAAAPASGRSSEIELKNYPFNRIIPVTQSLSGKDFAPDYYEMELSLIDGAGKVVARRRGQFIISPQPKLGHPIAYAKGFSLDNKFLYYYMLAGQYGKVDEREKAESFFRKAYELKPDYARGLVEYASFLVKVDRGDAALEMVEKIKDDVNLQFEYHLIRGKAFMGKKQYDPAIESFLEANKIYNSDIGVLNSLGLCYYQTGQKQKALDSLSASLRLNPQQEAIQKLVAEINQQK